MKRSSTSTHKCCYPTCKVNSNLSRTSRLLQYEVLKKFNFFITNETRVCRNHPKADSWENVNNDGKSYSFKSEHIERITEILRNPKPSCDQNAGKYNFHFFSDHGFKHNA